MKDLSQSDFLDAPAIVQFIWMASDSKQPIGSSILTEAMEKHPEYFPDEIEQQKKWAAVPQEIKDAYYKESWALYEKMSKDDPGHGKGILHYVKNPADFYKAMEMHEKRKPEYLRKMRLLHHKYLAKYGIIFDEKTA